MVAVSLPGRAREALESSLPADAMRIVIVDDEPLARARMRQILVDELGMQVVGEAANAGEARTAIEEQFPDALFVDIEMPGESGLDLAREMELTGLPVVIVTAHER
ncbi:MAG TPA: response regulator, partial [Thermoanaerobaculia bacterium]|nr:response regulator [Thermoanaerobaculia bacterium]